MIEVNKTYEFLSGIDQQAYGKNAKKWKEMMLRVPGLVELRSQRNILGSPSVRLTLVWKTLADCLEGMKIENWFPFTNN